MYGAYSFCTRGAGTLETGSIVSAFQVDAIFKKFGTIRPLVVELEIGEISHMVYAKISKRHISLKRR